MKKLFTVLLTAMLFAGNAYAETMKVDRLCMQNNDFVAVHVPIKLQYKNPKISYNKLLHLNCDDDFCGGVTMDADWNAKGVNVYNITVIRNLKRTVNKSGYVVLEWGINVVTVDFLNKKVSWNETGVDVIAGSGEASCN